MVTGVLQIVMYLIRPIRIGATGLGIGFLFMLSMAVFRLIRNAVTVENERLEKMCLMYPYQWYNFFNFWG